MAKPKFTFGVSDFVNAVYQSVFGKNVPDNFLNDREAYIIGIEGGEISPENFLEQVLLNDYIVEKYPTNEEFLKLCFKSMEVRSAPEKDWEFWLGKFATRSRRGIVLGLTLTKFWEKFCSKYEVK